MRTIGISFATHGAARQDRMRFTRHIMRPTLHALGILMFAHGSAFAQAKNASGILQELSSATAQVAKQATPAVVGIWVDIKTNAEQTSMRQSRDGTLETREVQEFVFLPIEAGSSDNSQAEGSPPSQFPQMQGHEQALGSGFIISSDGYILTNNHVVGNADLVLVIIGDDEPVRAEVVGTDPATDLAVIRLRGRNGLPVLPLGDSDNLQVGDWVVAIGQPFGLSHTITSGIVSALDRSNMDLTTYEDFIQTDAAINPGNSGGPLVNLAGQAVGVNTAILGPEGNIGIGFAIPINMAKNVYEQIRKNGKVIRGFIGVSIQELTPDLMTAFDLPKGTKGVLVAHVSENSPAAAAGLQEGDVIVQFEGKPVLSPGPFQIQVSRLQPGSKVPLVVLREAGRQSLTIELGTRGKPAPTKPSPRPTLEVAGMAIQDLDPDIAQRLGYQNPKGVVVVAVAQDSIAGFSGLSPGMLIQQVDHQPVEDIQQFQSALQAAAQKPPVLLLINNQGAYRYLVLAAPQP